MTLLHVILRVSRVLRSCSIDCETKESERFSEQLKVTQPSGGEWSFLFLQGFIHQTRVSFMLWENWIITNIFCWDGYILASNYPLVGSEWARKLQMEVTWLWDSHFSQSDILISCNVSLMGSVNLLWIIPDYLPKMLLLTFLLMYASLKTPLGRLGTVTVK